MPRDMTEARFREALARQGFKRSFAGLWFEHRDFPNRMFGGAWNVKAGRLNRRETIARLIRCRDKALAAKQEDRP